MRHVACAGVCNSVLPKTVRKANAQALAQKAGAGWMPADAKHEPVNLRGKKEDLVLAGKERTRVFWMLLLARGKLHLELLGSDFAGDHVSGMSTFVRKLKTSLKTRFRRDQPATVLVDLGGGFYQGGIITPEYKAALGGAWLEGFPW